MKVEHELAFIILLLCINIGISVVRILMTLGHRDNKPRAFLKPVLPRYGGISLQAVSLIQKQKADAEAELEQARLDLKLTQAKLDAARKKLERCRSR